MRGRDLVTKVSSPWPCFHISPLDWERFHYYVGALSSSFMHLKPFRISHFRRLRDVRIDLDTDTTIFVGANNSGKTAATHVFRTFLRKSRFRIYDFSASAWQLFDEF